MKKYTIIITGATATGKSSFAIELAKKISGEIINADIGSFYKPLTIGTAKPDWQSEDIPHHLFDIINKPISYSIAQFRKEVKKVIQDIWQRGNIPIIVGGSAFYIKSFFYEQEEIKGAEKFVKELEKRSCETKYLWQELYEIDGNRAKSIGRDDRYRIIRALAIFRATGRKPSEFGQRFMPLSDYQLVICHREREELYTRINHRVYQMIENGWIQEVKQLQKTAWKNFLLKKKIIGYDDLLILLQNDLSLDEVTPIIQQKTRNYAKRQITFLNKLYKELSEQNLDEDLVGIVDQINLTLCDVGLYIRQLHSQLLKRFG